MAKVRIGDRLISAGLITNEQLTTALEEQKNQTRRKKIVRTLVDLGYVDETKLLGFFVELCKRGGLNLMSILDPKIALTNAKYGICQFGCNAI